MHALLILGRDGQVGSALAALDWPGFKVTALGRAQADLTTEAAAQAIARLRPALVINAAAWTDVEGAQRDPAGAHAVNAQGAERLAQACLAAGAWLVHYSTDYVFDGAKLGAYTEADAPAPLNVYGASKLAGERAIAASGCRHLILRTGWVYSREGGNFFNKILARARGGTVLSVVDDQFGAPTWAHALALATRQAAVSLLRADNQLAGGLYHLSAAGRCSWYEAAQAVLAISGLGVPVSPVSSAAYAAAAPRPRNSQLDSSRFTADFGYRIGNWEEDLRRCFGATVA